MNKLKIRINGFYVLITIAVLLCWTVFAVIVLYNRGIQLTTIAGQSQQSETEAKNNAALFYPSRQALYVPSLNRLAACAQNIQPPPAIAARSAVVIDAASGALLFEKNPDQSIPPASLTKLVALYTVMQAVEREEIRLTDVITPPKEAWAVNIPPGSSLMFLGSAQKVSVEELMLGMSVVSGNDAAVALAIHIAGSVPAFVKRMNETVAALGLRNTSFEDPNGLSEKNQTTARDFARFSAVYIKKYPDHLKRFHAVRELSYPKPHNMLTPQAPVYQQATNTLLSKLEGCDGLKTGFIYESGFNLALTAQRNGIRFIAVILGGAGKNSKEGKRIREENGTALMEWAFSRFSTVHVQDIPLQFSPIPVLGAKGRADCTAIMPQLADPEGKNASFTIPISGNTAQNNAKTIRSRVLLPEVLSAPIDAGQIVGKIQFLNEVEGKEQTIAEFPLVAHKGAEKGSALRWKYDNLAFKFHRFLRRLSKD